MKFEIVSLFFLGLGTTLALQVIDVNKNYVGVGYSPYVGPWTGAALSASVPLWNSYSMADVLKQVQLIATKFNKISTYSAGTNQWNYVSFNYQTDYESNYKIAQAAAVVNNANPLVPLVTVNQGIYQMGSTAMQEAEINAAFYASQQANAMSPGTVDGITFTNEYINSNATGLEVLAMINANRFRLINGVPVPLGVRINTCDDIRDPSASLYWILQQISKQVDFIYCNLYPTDVTNPDAAVQSVSERFMDIKEKLTISALPQNPNLQIKIGETGWPSAGLSFNNSYNIKNNLIKFWNAMAAWASKNQVNVQMFEAFDEPWKSDMNNLNVAFNAANGGEGHYGLWTATRNSVTNEYDYVEKTVPLSV